MIVKGALKTANNNKLSLCSHPKVVQYIRNIKLEVSLLLKKRNPVEKSSELLEMNAWNSGERSDWRYKFKSFMQKNGNF